MLQGVFNSGWIYLLHAVLLGAGLWLLYAARFRDRPSPWRQIAVGAICVVGALYTYSVGEPKRPFGDFQDAYYPAGVAVLLDRASLGEVMADGVLGFVNLPIIAYLFAPFAILDIERASILFLVLGAGATAAAWYGITRLVGLERRDAAALLLLFATFGPLHNSIKEGNTSHVVLLVVVAALLLLQRRRDFLAGSLLALAAAVKLPLSLLGVYFLLSARWKVVAGGAATLLCLAAVSLALFGRDMHVQWFDAFVLSSSESKILAFNAQSVQAFFGRLETGGEYLQSWDARVVGETAALAGNLTVVLLYGVAVAVCVLPRGRAAARADAMRAELLDCCIVIALACVTSPLSWSHYYTWLLLPLAALLREWDQELLGVKGALSFVALVAVAAPVFFMQAAATSWVYSSVAVSHLLLGGVVLLGALCAARLREATPDKLAVSRAVT